MLHTISKYTKRLPITKVNRLKTIVSSSLNSLIVPFLSIALSFVITRLYSPSLWGEYVSVNVWIGFFLSLIAWGNKDYLLKKFSLKPHGINTAWNGNTISRALLLFASLLLLLLFTWDWNIKFLAMLLLLAKFLTQSFEVLQVYHRKFLLLVYLELLSATLLILCLFALPISFQLTHLLSLSICLEFLKVGILFFVFRRECDGFLKSSIDLSFFVSSFPFFIVTFSGMLQSKIDTLCASYFFPSDLLAKYNVLGNFLLLIQASSNFILLPFVKNMYRLQAKQTKKMAKQLLFVGIFISLMAIIAFWGISNMFYPFRYDWLSLGLGFLISVPVFYYLPTIYQLYKVQKQYHILAVNLEGFVLNLLLCILLIPLFEGINGALMAVAITQWLILLAYIYIENKVTQSIFAPHVD